jgi:hypothetical protein
LLYGEKRGGHGARRDHIVAGSLVALFGVYALLLPHRGVPFEIIIGLAALFCGVGFIMAGVGVVRRRKWGRILTLVMAGLTAVALLRVVLDLTGPYPGDSVQIIAEIVFLVLAFSYVCHGVYDIVEFALRRRISLRGNVMKRSISRLVADWSLGGSAWSIATERRIGAAAFRSLTAALKNGEDSIGGTRLPSRGIKR